MRALLWVTVLLVSCATSEELEPGGGSGGVGGAAASGGSPGGGTGGGAATGGGSSTGGMGGGAAGGGTGGMLDAGGTGAGGGTAGVGGTGGIGASAGTGATGGAATGGTGGSGGSATGGSGGSATGGSGGGSPCQSDNTRVTLRCGDGHSGSFFGAYGDVQDICGKTFAYQDQLFVFAATSPAQVTVTYTASPDATDMALFVMEGSCHSGQCIADSTTTGDRHSVSFSATAGVTYYIDLEAPSAQPDYSIQLACQ